MSDDDVKHIDRSVTGAHLFCDRSVYSNRYSVCVHGVCDSPGLDDEIGDAESEFVANHRSLSLSISLSLSLALYLSPSLKFWFFLT